LALCVLIDLAHSRTEPDWRCPMTDTKAFHLVADTEDDLKVVHDVAIAITRLRK
jgi:hypothetical protein